MESENGNQCATGVFGNQGTGRVWHIPKTPQMRRTHSKSVTLSNIGNMSKIFYYHPIYYISYWITIWHRLAKEKNRIKWLIFIRYTPSHLWVICNIYLTISTLKHYPISVPNSPRTPANLAPAVPNSLRWENVLNPQ